MVFGFTLLTSWVASVPVSDRTLSKLPLLSTRKNGDRLVGYSDGFAEELYAAGTPPMHGLAAKPAPSERVQRVRVGDELQVQREGDRWYVLDSDGPIGQMRWKAGDEGRKHATTGVIVRYPAVASLHVRRLVLDPDGQVKDIGGTIHP